MDASPMDAAAGCTDTWANYGQAFMQANCTRCHAQFTTYAGVSADSTNIRSQVSGGLMPPDFPLTASAISRFIAWIDCGMPQ
jgi:hypothetical protein